MLARCDEKGYRLEIKSAGWPNPKENSHPYQLVNAMNTILILDKDATTGLLKDTEFNKDIIPVKAKVKESYPEDDLKTISRADAIIRSLSSSG